MTFIKKITLNLMKSLVLFYRLQSKNALRRFSVHEFSLVCSRLVSPSTAIVAQSTPMTIAAIVAPKWQKRKSRYEDTDTLKADSVAHHHLLFARVAQFHII
jgi:hypothetical protein